jgi:3-hydroxyisobutyrate dehydrogenase-like beta-hydroxyacid dehydrogenase
MADGNGRIGFIGLGLMGQAFTRRLVACGYRVTGYDVRPQQIAAAQAHGVEPAGSAAEVARASELVHVCVMTKNDLAAAVFGPDGVAAGGAAGKLLVDHSTTDAGVTRAFAERLGAEAGMGWVDAPVSGGVPGIESRTLVVMAGGDERDVAEAQPVLAAYAGRVTRMGPVGAGQTTKLINQVLVGTGFVALAEAFRLARDAGVDAARIPACLVGGRADSRLLQEYMPHMAAGDMTVRGRIDILVKDLDTVHELARETGTPMPFAQLACELHRLMVAQGRGAADNAAIIRLYGERDEG